MLKFKKARRELTKTYQKEQIENQINKIRNLVEDRKLQLAWQTVNEVSWRKSTPRARLKAATQEEKLDQWKEHFKNLLRNPSEITNTPTE